MNDTDLQRTFRYTPGLFIVMKADPAFTIVAASDDYLRATYTTPAIFGRPVFEVFPDNPADADASGVSKLGASLQRVVATGTPDTVHAQRYDVQLSQEAGGGFEERYWTTVNTPLLSDEGEVSHIIQRTQDATARANMSAVEILESITEGFFTLDRRWRFDYVNREAHRILSREPGSLAGKVLWDEYPGLEGTEFQLKYHQTMFQRERASFTAFYPDHGYWYEVTTSPAPEGISVYFRNVTAQRTLETEREKLVAESEKQRRIYEAALDSTPDFSYVFGVDHRALYANDALLKTWGVEDVRGKTWLDLGYEKWHADMHDREIDQVIATRAPIRGEIPFTGTGGRRVYDYIFAPVFGANGEVVAVAGTTRDITERQAAEQSIRDQAARLAEVDRSKDEFLATLSHELRNPLAPLRNSIALLRKTAKPGESTAGIHSMMERQVNHLVRLVDDLLELSRISRGLLSLRRENLEVSTLVRNSMETGLALAESAGHELVTELADEPLWVNGDSVRIVQILANLLDNAIKYTESGGRITVRAWKNGDSVAISVRDNGMGIQPEALPRMFEMFSRGDRDVARAQGGLGIGLALSRRLAEMHEGTLDARSEGHGQGSEFTLRLPLVESGEATGVAKPAADLSLALTRVLVVDDNHDAGDSLAMVMEMLGAEVRVARDGAEALEAYAAYEASVVLLDIGMPGMSGYDVARTMRSRFPGRRTVLVALTGWGQEEDRRRAKEAGFDHHMVKPAEIDALQELLSSIEKSARASK